MPNITPFLWFDHNAEEAVALYSELFPGAKVHSRTPGPDGRLLVIDFELNGQRFLALNGGPHFKFSEAISFVVSCDSQEEIDHYWDGLTANGGAESQCGWLKDRFGVTWQIVPRNIGEIARSPAAMQAMMPMKKIDLAVLNAALK